MQINRFSSLVMPAATRQSSVNQPNRMQEPTVDPTFGRLNEKVVSYGLLSLAAAGMMALAGCDGTNPDSQPQASPSSTSTGKKFNPKPSTYKDKTDSTAGARGGTGNTSEYGKKYRGNGTSPGSRTKQVEHAR